MKERYEHDVTFHSVLHAEKPSRMNRNQDRPNASPPNGTGYWSPYVECAPRRAPGGFAHTHESSFNRRGGCHHGYQSPSPWVLEPQATGVPFSEISFYFNFWYLFLVQFQSELSCQCKQWSLKVFEQKSSIHLQQTFVTVIQYAWSEAGRCAGLNKQSHSLRGKNSFEAETQERNLLVTQVHK